MKKLKEVDKIEINNSGNSKKKTIPLSITYSRTLSNISKTQESETPKQESRTSKH